jgi:phosphate transport system permease protein
MTDPTDPALRELGASLDDPTAPPVPHEDSHLIGSVEPMGISVAEDGPPVLGAGAASVGGRGKARLGDRVFSALSVGAGGFIVLLVILVAVFLLIEAIPAIQDDKVNFFTSRTWQVTGASKDEAFGMVGLLWTTVLISVFAMVIAVPVSIGIALFITQYAPARLARPVAYVIDLLAAIPSIIYGIWGIAVLAPQLTGLQNGLSSALGWIPLFKDRNNQVGTVFDGGIVLAIMILPIITSIAREVFERTPRANIEASLALGATKWEMIRMSVLPYGRPGVISGAMLGLGRALGETIAVYLIVRSAGNGAAFDASLFGNGTTFAAQIAKGGDALFAHPGPYIAAGLVLFALTFIVNAGARAVVARRKEFS